MGPPGGTKRVSAARAAVWGAAVGFALLFIALLNAVYFVQSSTSVHRAVDPLGGAADAYPAAALSRAGRAGSRAASPCACPPPSAADPSSPGGAAAATGPAAGGNATAEAAALQFLQQYVLKQPQLSRPAEPFFWLESPTAKNETVAVYRSKASSYSRRRIERRMLHAACSRCVRMHECMGVRLHGAPCVCVCIQPNNPASPCAPHRNTKVQAYLSGDSFKRRVEALRQQKGHARGIVISTGGPYYLPQVRRCGWSNLWFGLIRICCFG